MKISEFLVGRQKLVLMKGGGGIFAEFFREGGFSDFIDAGESLDGGHYQKHPRFSRGFQLKLFFVL